MAHYLWIPWLAVVGDFSLRLIFCLNIIRRKLPVGVAWAWLCLVLLLPLVGTVLYLYLGEYRMGRRRRARLVAASRTVAAQLGGLGDGTGQELIADEAGRSFARTVNGFFESPVLAGNSISLLVDADAAFPALIADIDAAERSCDLEFYIWSDGGRADAFAQALIRARGRGVRCRVLVDAVGSASFVGGAVARDLRDAGVEIRTALPSGPLSTLFRRPDLRLHRKIVVIDGARGYTGSLNMADPVRFHRSAGVGPWVDAMCRIQGKAVRALHLVFLSDWSAETGAHLAELEKDSPFEDEGRGAAPIQCIASVPAVTGSAVEETIVAALYSARRSLTLTTPYFLPSEALSFALVAAARRQVAVTLIVPEKVDSWLIQHASQAFLKELSDAGVRVALFQGGLLHTKSLVVDGSYSFFGSLNLDPRSLRINYEISLAVYDAEFTQALAALQAKYLGESRMFGSDQTARSGPLESLKEGVSRLVGPLL